MAAWDAAVWTALGTLAYAAVALVAAVVAFRHLKEIRLGREEQARPFVVVDIVPSDVGHNILNLVVENVGKTLARDVEIIFWPPITSSIQGYDLNSSALIADGIPAMPPGRRVEVLFDVGHERLKTKLPLRYETTVRCLDARGRKQESLSYLVDMSFLYGLRRVTELGIHDAAKALKDLAATINNVTSAGEIRVSARSQDARDAADNFEIDLTGQVPSLGREPPLDLVMFLGRSSFVRSLVATVRQLQQRRARRRADRAST